MPHILNIPDVNLACNEAPAGLPLTVWPTGKQYGVYKEGENISFRALFLPDPKGRILDVEMCDLHVGCPQAHGGCHGEQGA